MARARMPRKPSKKRVEAALEALAGVRRDWHRRPGVTAVDVGFRREGGHIVHEIAIRVHVRRKLPPESLTEEELLPENLGAFPVDVIEAAYAPQAGPPPGRGS